MEFFEKVAYFDTNIISLIARNDQIHKQAVAFLENNDLVLALTDAVLTEIVEAQKLHDSVVRSLSHMPIILVRSFDRIICEEIEAHPNQRYHGFWGHRVQGDELVRLLASPDLAKSREIQRSYADRMLDHHKILKANFPPAQPGKYILEQAEEFAEVMIIQMLRGIAAQFLKKMRCDISNFHPEIFLSLRLYAFLIYYKYYLGNRDPKLSDFGDLFHIFYFPYCSVVVTERDLCNVLTNIKNHQEVLKNTHIENIDLFKRDNTVDTRGDMGER